MKLHSVTLNMSLLVILSACGSTENKEGQSIDPNLELTSSNLESHRLRCADDLRMRLRAGFSDHCFVHGNLKRQVRVYRPKSLRDSPQATAVIFALHGGGGSGEQASDITTSGLGVFTQIAEEQNLVIVYPTATADKTGKNGWNDCRSDDTSKNGVDDSSFLADLSKEFSQNLNLPSHRIFFTGHSNGAMMSFRMALEHGDLIGGIATSAGNIAQKPITGACSTGPSTPIPVLMMHGSKDTFVPPEGGCVANLRNKRRCERGHVVSAKESIEFWLKGNNHSKRIPQKRTVDINKRDGGPAVESKYTAGDAPVVAWMLHGAGHPIASTTVKVRPFIVGKQNRDVEFAREAWRFFDLQMQ